MKHNLRSGVHPPPGRTRDGADLGLAWPGPEKGGLFLGTWMVRRLAFATGRTYFLYKLGTIRDRARKYYIKKFLS